MILVTRLWDIVYYLVCCACMHLLLDYTPSVRDPAPCIVVCSVDEPCRSIEQSWTTFQEDTKRVIDPAAIGGCLARHVLERRFQKIGFKSRTDGSIYCRARGSLTEVLGNRR